MIIKTVDVRCDAPDCNAISENDSFGQTAADARANARAKGWTRPSRTLDLCPKHSEGGDRG